MASILDKLTDAEAMKFIDQVAEPFKNAPHLPKNIVEILVSISPWLVIIGLIGEVLAILGSIAVLALSPVFALVSLVMSVVAAALMFKAYTPLKNREMQGWVYMFWIEIFAVAGSVVFGLVGRFDSIISAIIGLVIGLYLLFEVRSAYGPVKAAVKKIEEVTK